MKFLLTAVNAKYIHSNPAVYSLRAYAGEELGQYIELAEYTINQRMQDILADIYKRKPDIIGFSCYIWNWEMIQAILQELPKLLPQTDIWLGGPEVTYDADKILQKYPQLTGIMVGEGEATFKELLECYLAEDKTVRQDQMANPIQAGSQGCIEEKLRTIAGLCLSTGYTPMRPLTNMDDLPFLYNEMDPFVNRIIYYETSRGCPYRCSYCLSSIDKQVRMRDISVIKKELQFFLDIKVPQVKFVDRTFNCNHKHAMDIWQYLYEHDNSVTNFHFEISADILQEDEIALLNKLRPGLAQLEIGVQSTNEETLHAIRRVMNVERLEQIVAAIQAGHNIHLHLDLIAGLPYEDYQSFGHSFDRVYAMKPEQLQLGFLKILKGSEMYERAEEFGICYLDSAPYEVLYTKWLPYEKVQQLKRIEEMVELYYNSSQYTHTLPFLLRAFDSPFAMYGALADFYEKNGYFVNSPARAYRYQVLLQFAGEQNAEEKDIYRELLIYDMYLRENLKSRPDFAGETGTDETTKKKIRAFFQEEEQTHRYLPDYQGHDWKQLSKMTHLEPFHYPVWDMDKWTKTADNSKDNPSICRYVLFDYRNRSPLTHEASVQVIQHI